MKILFKLHAIRGEETGSNIAQLSCQKMEVLGVLGPRAISVSERSWERGQQGPGQLFAFIWRDGQGTSFQGGFGKEVTPPGNCWLCGTKEQPKGIRHPQKGKTWMGYESQSISDPSPLPS